MVYMYLGLGVVACVTKETFLLSHKISHWHLGTGGQNMQGWMFEGAFAVFFSCLLVLPPHRKCLLPSLLYTSILLRGSREQKSKWHFTDTPGFGPVAVAVSQCDPGHVVKHFDFFEAVCMTVRARMMDPGSLGLNSNSNAS